MNYLYSKEFLSKLDKTNHKEVYAKVIALDFNENPTQMITGRVTAGSVNVDGSSAVRRTCSVTVVAATNQNEFQYDDYLWGLNTKFKLEIGLKNMIDRNYPDIIWFPQGIYVLTSFNLSRSATNFTVNLSGKDKMCLLNGEIGGTLNSSIDFGTIEEIDKFDNTVIRKLSLKDIIRNIVHVYGNEPYHNIIINDLDILGKELLEYRYDESLYLYRPAENGSYYTNVLMESNKVNLSYIDDKGKEQFIENKTLKDSPLPSSHLELLTNNLSHDVPDAKVVYNVEKIGSSVKKTPYYFTKINYGDTAGYRITDLVYAGDLIANVGESITSVLDKIKNMLVEYEYFYNLDGQFIFQKKPCFISTPWALISQDGEEQAPSYAYHTSQTLDYTFFQTELISALSNNPNLANVKNDFTVKGERTGVSGAKIPIHLRYAIDEKPIEYKAICVEENNAEVDAYNQKYNTDLKYQPNPILYQSSDDYFYDKTKKIMKCDWREVLYQMAQDYYKYNHLSDFEQRVAAANPDLFPFGITGYEVYYIDIYSFWRELYYPEVLSEFDIINDEWTSLKEWVENRKGRLYGTEVDWSENLYGGMEQHIATLNNLLETEDPDKYNEAKDLVDKWNKAGKYDLYEDAKKKERIEEPTLYLNALQALYYKEKSELTEKEIKLEDLESQKNKLESYKKENFYTSGNRINWNKNVYERPSLLNFWFDFLDSSADLSKYSVHNIGSRPKAIQDTNIKSIYFRETPEILFTELEEEVKENTPLRVIQVPFIETMFTISAQGKSAKERLDELIYQHSGMIETASITTVPIYYLQPNNRVKIVDNDTKLNGDYTITKITIPLTYNGMMTLSLTKVIDSVI